MFPGGQWPKEGTSFGGRVFGCTYINVRENFTHELVLG